MSNCAIQVEELSKKYTISHESAASYATFRDTLAKSAASLGRRALRALRRSPQIGPDTSREEFWALRDVSFEVKKGERLGIVGRNGAGKTTLLRILSRITDPTRGRVVIRGRVASLLEVGTGFHPELTGSENVYLNGAILGMSKREIREKFDAIVAFSEVEKFLDTPLKRYSSGMQVRLAFAVAAHLEPEILLVDEVLAVGDLPFQKKCLGQMEELAHGGRTILFVSHQMNQIRRLCQKVIWVEGGHLRKVGGAAQVVGAYEAAMAAGDHSKPFSDGSRAKAQFLRWEIVEPRSENPHLLAGLGPVTVKFVVRVNRPLNSGHHGVALFTHENQLVWATAADNIKLGPGDHELCYVFPMLPVRPGAYFWHVSLYDDQKLADAWLCLPEMIVATENHQHPDDRWNGMLNVPSDFSINGTSSV